MHRGLPFRRLVSLSAAHVTCRGNDGAGRVTMLASRGVTCEWPKREVFCVLEDRDVRIASSHTGRSSCGQNARIARTLYVVSLTLACWPPPSKLWNHASYGPLSYSEELQ